MSIYVRLMVAAITSFALLTATANAAPQFAKSEDGEPYTYGFGGYQVIDQIVNRGEGAFVTLEDRAVCADNIYDENLNDGDGGYVDVLGNDFGMVGASVVVEGNAGGTWKPVGQAVVTRQDMEENTVCEEDYDENDNLVMSGQAQADVSVKFRAPAVRQQTRVRVTGASVVGELISQEETLFPRFSERFEWYPGPLFPKEKKKGYTVVIIKADKRLVGTKVQWVASNRKNEKWRTVKTTTFKKKGSGAYAKLERKRSKKDGWSYVCINYAAKFPQMSTGNACPKGPISRAKMNELFPGSANGYVG